MDKYMAINFRSSSSLLEIRKGEFIRALTFCEKIWGDEGFTKPDGNTRAVQGYFDIEMVCSSLLSDQEYQKAIRNPMKVREGLIELLNTDDTFLDAVSQFTSNKDSVKYRIETFSNLLKTIE